MEIKYKIKSDIINYNERPIYGVYFICCIGNYLQIIEEQLYLLSKSGLLDKTKKIFCYICCYNPMDKDLHKLFNNFYHKIEFFSTPYNLYEKFAINNFKQNIPQEQYYIYYFHTKGVSKPENTYWTHRRHILNHYTLLKYEISIKLLKYYDAVGVTLFKYPKLHFSGNFWWSKSEHINSLPNLIGNKYLEPEMYICSNNNKKYIGLSKEDNVFEKSNINNHLYLIDDEILNNLINKPIDNLWGKNAQHLC